MKGDDLDTGFEHRRGSRPIALLRAMAALLALCFMIGEIWRSWGVGRPIMFVLDDQLMGGFLLASAFFVQQTCARSRRAFSAAWGVVTGMLYTSFFGEGVRSGFNQPRQLGC